MIEDEYSPISQRELGSEFRGICFHVLDPDDAMIQFNTVYQEKGPTGNVPLYEVELDYSIKIGKHNRAHSKFIYLGKNLDTAGNIVSSNLDLLPEHQKGHSMNEFGY